MKKMPTGLKTLAFKLSVAVFVINIVFFTALGVIFSRRFAAYIESSLRSDSEIPVQIMNDGAISFSLARDRDVLRKIVGREIEQSMVIQPTGHILYSSNQDLEGQDLLTVDSEHPILFQLQQSGEAVQVLNPIYRTLTNRSFVAELFSGDHLAGYLWLMVNTEHDQWLTNIVTLIFFVGSLITILVSGFMQIKLICRLVIPRIIRTVDCLRKVESGKLNAHIKGPRSSDEIGVLEQGVNRVISEVADQSLQKEELAKKLEEEKKKVEEAENDAVDLRTVAEGDRKQAEDARLEADNAIIMIESANKAKAEYLANTSCEIRAPLNGVLGMTELLLDSQLEKDQRVEAETILRSGEALLEVVDSIQNLAKVEGDQMELAPEPLDLQELTDQLVSFFASKSERTGVPLQLVLDEDLPFRLMVARSPLQQALLNLIDNAFKFTSEGSIDLGVELLEQDDESSICTLKFYVRDTGIGISDEAKEDVFKAFYQTEGDLPSDHRGVGLGLTISSRIVAKMGGAIEVDSDLGSGSTFSFTLQLESVELDLEEEPDDESEEIVEEPPVEPVDASLLKDKRVLVVEGDQANRLLVGGLLKSLDCDVVEALTGQEALDLEEADDVARFDMILIDIQMPDMDGVEVIKLIRDREEPEASVPVVGFSAYATRVDEEPLLENGMNDFLSIPIRRQRLADMLLKHLA